MCWEEDKDCAKCLESHSITVKNDIKKDKFRSNASKVREQKKNQALKEKEDNKRNKELDAKAKVKKEAAAKAALNGGTVVGKNRKDATTPVEAATLIQNNLNQQQTQQQPGTKIAGTANCLGCFAMADNENFPKFVDADTAVNDLNKSVSSNYFSVLLNNTIRKLDCIDESNGNFHCCVDTAKFIPRVRSDGSNHCLSGPCQIVPDSGSMLHMLIEHTDFDPSTYKCCENMFVLMGDALQAPVAGYGTEKN